MPTIKVRYTRDVDPIDRTPGGDWVDLRAAESIDLKAGEYTIIPLGVAMQLPLGYEAHVAPRSSTFKNWGVIQTNGVGVIDYAYRGDDDEWGMPVYATRDTHIDKNDRVCQFRIVAQQPKLSFSTYESFGAKNRGGFGSTGKK